MSSISVTSYDTRQESIILPKSNMLVKSRIDGNLKRRHTNITKFEEEKKTTIKEEDAENDAIPYTEYDDDTTFVEDFRDAKNDIITGGGAFVPGEENKEQRIVAPVGTGVVDEVERDAIIFDEGWNNAHEIIENNRTRLNKIFNRVQNSFQLNEDYLNSIHEISKGDVNTEDSYIKDIECIVTNKVANCLIDFIILVQEIILSIQDKDDIDQEHTDIAIYYLSGIRDLFDQAKKYNKEEVEKLILCRFMKGGYYIRRVLTLLNYNFRIPNNKPRVYFQDIIMDVEFKTLFIESIRMLHIDNTKKRNSSKQSEVNLKSNMYIMKDNIIKMVMKNPKDDSALIKPSMHLILPVNFTPLESDTELSTKCCQFIIMLFESTLIMNKLDIKQNSRTLRRENFGSGIPQRMEGFRRKMHSFPEEINYIIACIKGNMKYNETKEKWEYNRILTILSSVDILLLQTVTRAINNVMGNFRYKNKDSDLDIHDALDYIISDDYTCSVFCELVGLERFLHIGQVSRYHTRVQTLMTVVLNEQHVDYLCSFLHRKLLGL